MDYGLRDGSPGGGRRPARAPSTGLQGSPEVTSGHSSFAGARACCVRQGQGEQGSPSLELASLRLKSLKITQDSGHLPPCTRTRVTVHQPLHPGASHPVSSNPAHLQPSPAVSSRLQPSQATNQPNDPILGRNQSRTLQKCPERDCCSRWLPIPWGSSLDDVCDAPASQIPAGSAYPTSVHDRYEVTFDRYMVVA